VSLSAFRFLPLWSDKPASNYLTPGPEEGWAAYSLVQVRWQMLAIWFNVYKNSREHALSTLRLRGKWAHIRYH